MTMSVVSITRTCLLPCIPSKEDVGAMCHLAAVPRGTWVLRVDIGPVCRLQPGSLSSGTRVPAPAPLLILQVITLLHLIGAIFKSNYPQPKLPPHPQQGISSCSARSCRWTQAHGDPRDLMHPTQTPGIPCAPQRPQSLCATQGDLRNPMCPTETPRIP